MVNLTYSISMEYLPVVWGVDCKRSLACLSDQSGYSLSCCRWLVRSAMPVQCLVGYEENDHIEFLGPRLKSERGACQAVVVDRLAANLQRSRAVLGANQSRPISQRRRPPPPRDLEGDPDGREYDLDGREYDPDGRCEYEPDDLA